MLPRTKGIRYELDVIKFFKRLGYENAMSTRASSRLLDNCKIDINFLPFLIQAKSGYEKNRPNYLALREECHALIKKFFPKKEAKELLKKPYLLFHRTKGNKQTVTMTVDFFEELLLHYPKQEE